MRHTITHLLHALNRPTPMKRERARTQNLAPRHLSQEQAARTDNVRNPACLSMGKIDRLTEQSCDACEAGRRRAKPRSSPSQLAAQASQRAHAHVPTAQEDPQPHSNLPAPVGFDCSGVLSPSSLWRCFAVEP